MPTVRWCLLNIHDWQAAPMKSKKILLPIQDLHSDSSRRDNADKGISEGSTLDEELWAQ